MSLEEEILKQVAPLPTLSSGLRSRILAAALEAQDSRRHSRRVIAGSLSLFALLSWFSWRMPNSRNTGSAVATATARDGSAAGRSPPSGAPLSPLGLVGAAMGDDFSAVELQLQSRQDYFRRIHPM
jgi:hypothetical protein